MVQYSTCVFFSCSILVFEKIFELLIDFMVLWSSREFLFFFLTQGRIRDTDLHLFQIFNIVISLNNTVLFRYCITLVVAFYSIAIHVDSLPELSLLKRNHTLFTLSTLFPVYIKKQPVLEKYQDDGSARFCRCQ